MTAYNFPDTPVNGQLFAPKDGPIWQWDGQVWLARKQLPQSGVVLSGHGVGGLGKAGEGPHAISEATIGDVLPALGSWLGQLWWESDTGRMFIWYDDGTSTQWVQIIAPISISEASGAIVTATGGTVPRALSDWFAGMGRVEDPPELGFWADRGPVNVWRMRDRVLIGTGAVYDAKRDQSTGSWLGEPEASPGDGNAARHWMERAAQFYAGSTKGGISILGSTRTKDKKTDSLPTIAIAGYAYADGSGVFSVDDARGGFFEATRGVVSMARVIGLDIRVENRGNLQISNSYQLEVPGSTWGMRLAAGNDPLSIPPVTAENSTAALLIGKSSARWDKGIIFDAVGLEGTDVAGNGKAVAIEMARGHALKWRYGSIPEMTSAEIRSDNYDKAAETRIIFTSNGLTIKCLDTTQTVELMIAEFPANGGATIYPSISSGAADISISALGQSDDADIRFVPKGTGNVITPKSIVACYNMAIPSGGISGAGFLFSSTAEFGVFFGAGAPTISGAQGSLYLRSDGEINSRTYISIGDGWIPLVDDNSDKVDVSHIGSGGDAHAEVISGGLNGFMTGSDKAKLDSIVDVVPGGISGLMTGTDKTKLNNILDVTSGGPSGLMTGVDKTKLDNVLPVVPGGNPGLMIGADKAKLDAMVGATGIPDVTPGGPSGLMTGSDKTRLDGIQPVIPGGAAGLMTGADKSRFDTFIDVTPDGPSGLMKGLDKTKLDNIVDVTPGGSSGLMPGADKAKLDGFPATIVDVAPTGNSGLMTSEDKLKLDTIQPVARGGIPGLMLGEDKTKLDAMTTGTGTFIDIVFPVGATSWGKLPGVIAIDVWVQAGGGGGAGAQAIAGESAAGSGGGGGAYGYKSYNAAALASMSTIDIVVGQGGVGGTAANGAGGTGGASSFGSLSCTGGLGGIASNSGTTAVVVAGGKGGLTGSGAQVPVHGSSGQPVIRLGTPSIAAGGGGGTAGGGCGGAPAQTISETVGNAGAAGSGGSGAVSSNGGVGAAGGVGGNGFVKIREYY